MIIYLPVICLVFAINAGAKLKHDSVANIPEDGRLDFVGLATKYGANTEEHDIVTDDGYVLKLFHLVGDRTRPVLLNHGILQSSDTFILRGNTSLAIQLVKRGYDVWLLNVRGNRYSRRHLYLNPNTDEEFWDYSFVEFAKFDISAAVDYILQATGEKRLSVIGFSEGTTSMYALGILKPEYNDKVKIHVSLAPVCYMYHTRPITLNIVQNIEHINRGLLLLNSNEVLSFYSAAKKLSDVSCIREKVGYDLCLLGIILPVTGGDKREIEEEFSRAAMGHFPAGTSRKNLYHLGQLGLRKFSHFDYGSMQNKAVYGTDTPPKLNLAKVTMKTALIVGRGDRISTVKDVRLLRDALPNVVKYIELQPDSFGHLNFVWGRNTHRLMFPMIFKLLEKYK
ncbi:hypothetical protein K1T71_008043 [Dendrolimus kikuchii]|uniref:Uncharacterized protein n=1 Tax=Dendrolimus kikuchii TaxID=765133 RepID=A0ACC1CYR3_9NEOP|nr:hypothetical protein K1T71_008043 [Dendrolimus kikuchii]